MLSRSCTTLILLVGLAAATAQASAIKGHHHQPVQRAEEQTRLAGSIKSPVAQQPDRSPKSAPAHVQQPILESSKKVYNDESIRRSLSQQQLAESVPLAVKAAAPVVEPVSVPVDVPVVVSQPINAPVVEQQPAVPVKEPAVVSQEPAKAQPVPVAAPVEVVKVSESPAGPVAKPAEELPPQSARSAPIKDEVKPAIVESAVPAKAPVVEPVPIAVPQQQQQQQQAPVVAESKPVAPEPQVQPAAPVVAQSQPEPVVEPLKPAVVDSPLQAKKDEPAKDSAEPIEVPAPDPGLVLSEPIDSTTKLLIDLDEHVQKFLPAEDKQEPVQPPKDQVLVSGVDYSPQAQPSGKSSAPLVPYSSNVESESIVPPLPAALDKVQQASGAQSGPSQPASVAAGQSATRQANHQHQNQQQVITQLLDQLDSLQNRIQDTINQLVARRRYVMSALLRPMGTYVRRVRTNLERLQNRVNQLQAAASSVGNNSNGQRPGGFVDAAAIETIRRRIDDISKRISDIVNRIRFSLTPTSAPLNSNGRK